MSDRTDPSTDAVPVSDEEHPILLVCARSDPVASALGDVWETGEPTGWSVDGAPVRRWADGPYLLWRTGPHIHDERLDDRLPPELARRRPTLVFPSIHRSRENVRCFTVHPLGNPTARARYGGSAATLNPTDPVLMANVLTLLTEHGRPLGRPATYEATHHGPELHLPSFFVEIGYGELSGPPEEEVHVLSHVLRRLRREPGSEPVLGLGGGHYAPHFTALALSRRWAFGHILSRHALLEAHREIVRAALELTPGASGALLARAADGDLENVRGVVSRLRESAAGPRPGATETIPSARSPE